MRPAYAYLGIGLIFLLSIIAFINGGFTRPADNERMATSTPSAFKLSSTAFEPNASIPSIYTCDGTQISPPLTISDPPLETKSFALIVQDPDVPKQIMPSGVFVHWVLFNIPSDTKEMMEGKPVGTPGANGGGHTAYAGPCPPPQYEPAEHRYFFTLYALDTTLPLQTGASKEDVEQAMEGHILAQAELIGRYKKEDKK